MWAKLTCAFLLGFAIGALLLGGILWHEGWLNNPAVSAGNSATGATLPPPQPSPAPIAPETAQPTPTPQPEGEASRDAAPGVASSLHLAMPIAGVDPKSLKDTFNEIHDGRKHEALDIPAPRGTPVLAVAEGNVVKLFNSKPGGLTVYQFDDSNTYCYYYAHLDHYAAGLKEGTLLRKGDVLGYVGSTGNASPAAPHLHFAVTRLGQEKKWWEGVPINPLPLLQ
jgi:murein DD-endopeptidase MepM/ murein hydrolase activator NlpD